MQVKPLHEAGGIGLADHHEFILVQLFLVAQINGSVELRDQHSRHKSTLFVHREGAWRTDHTFSLPIMGERPNISPSMSHRV